jgi:type VI secretion system ImpA/VasJ family protein
MLAPDTLLAIGTQPVAGDAPAGASARYDDIFARLEAEVSKLDNPSGGEVNWKQACADAAAILEKSKDLLVAAYLTRSLYALQGLGGVVDGVTVCRNLLDTFWEGMHPQRPRARRSALEWMSERLAVLVDPQTIRPQELPQVRAALEVVEDIWLRFNDRFDGEDCGLATLRRRLQEIASSDTSSASPATAGGAPAEAGATSSNGSTSMIASGPVVTRAAAIQRLNEVSDYFKTFEPHSPVGMLVERAIHWSQIGFEELFQELLKDKSDARDHIWNTLGIKAPDHV